jgi:hypothetical protein
MANAKKGTKIPIILAQLSVWMGVTENRKSRSNKGRRRKCIWSASVTAGQKDTSRTKQYYFTREADEPSSFSSINLSFRSMESLLIWL